MKIGYCLNGRNESDEIDPNVTLLKFLRSKGCYSVKCGCETTNCGLCTVWLDDTPVLSCAVLAVRIDGHQVTTLEGLRQEALEFARYMGREGADQCGFCTTGMMMSAINLKRKNPKASDDEIREYLIGNLCRCTGYESQLRGVRKFLEGGLK